MSALSEVSCERISALPSQMLADALGIVVGVVVVRRGGHGC
jgi:hypothetical protein